MKIKGFLPHTAGVKLAAGLALFLTAALLRPDGARSLAAEQIVTSAGETGLQTEAQQAEMQQTETLQTEVQQTEEADPWVEEHLHAMTIEEKVAQMFILTPEALTGVGQVTAAGDMTREAFERWPVGGLVYFESNLVSETQIRDMLSGVQAISMQRTGLPLFTCVDEEGGQVRRISGRGILDVPYIDAAGVIGQGTPDNAFVTGTIMGTYLSDLGFNVDFAPVADVLSNPSNQVIGDRSFGSDPNTAANMVGAFTDGLRIGGVQATLKHFPGHGDTALDSHSGTAVSYKTAEQLRECEFLPFAEGIAHGAEFVMVGHISLPEVTGDNTPATLSGQIITGMLREELGFEGIIVTDAMAMGAVANYYSSGDAAVRSIQAGADMILMPADFASARQGVLDALATGSLTEERIDASVRRILNLKHSISGNEKKSS